MSEKQNSYFIENVVKLTIGLYLIVGYP